MIAGPPFRIERLAGHDRKAFSCGEQAIDNWFITVAGQQMSRGLTVVQVLVDQGTGTIAGFYSLSNYAVHGADLPDAVGKKLPSQMMIPMHLLGKLGVHRDYQGRGVG